MNIERISSVGATIIALAALVASQFPPLYTYFQSGEVVEDEIADFALRCGKQGVFLTTKVPYQNVGDGYATILSIRLKLRDQQGTLVADFQDPRVQSEKKVDALMRPVFEPFVRKAIAPTEHWVASAVFDPDWSNQNIEAMRVLLPRLDDALGYSGFSFDIEEEYDIDPELISALSNAYQPLIDWVEPGNYVIALNTIWNDEDGKRHTLTSETRFALSASEAAAVKRYYSPDFLSENPDFFRSCLITPDIQTTGSS
ncbi:hypothetical protein [Pseudovibrio exalbescens]|uniref:Uncharacterized protein n=1 Tax=Pseudovibrio exalbescens TaxID=197461 RepID=A0A1U7JJ98_9HYPH|nr:hypothetical protein [Pseudovibrio exalbescens]OKL44762.1 hypothetical protein A3843_06690 [Pseudovibrio exalbescens]